MKSIRYILPALIAVTTALSCKKQIVANPESLSSLTIANAIVGGTQAKLGSIVAQVQNISNNAGTSFTLPAGTNRIYVWPVGDSLHPYYNESLTTAHNEIYSLFLTGTPGAIESLLIKEALPVHTDSTFGIRFINLSPGSPAVKVTLSTSTTISEFGDLAYKEASAFKTYNAFSTNTTYTFQVRNAATEALISSFVITGASPITGIPRFTNVTLILRGKVSGVPAAGISRINHFVRF